MDLDSNFLSASSLYNSHNTRRCSLAGDLSVWRVKSEVGFPSHTSTAAASSWTLRCAYCTEYSWSSNPTAQNCGQEKPKVRKDLSLGFRGRHCLRKRNQRCSKNGSSRSILFPRGIS